MHSLSDVKKVSLQFFFMGAVQGKKRGKNDEYSIIKLNLVKHPILHLSMLI